MAQASKTGFSPEVIKEAAQLAKQVKKPQQTKEQTKLVEQGIRKGLALYKRQQKAQARQQDKLRKKRLKQLETATSEEDSPAAEPKSASRWLPWGLLVLSWLGFMAYITLNR